MTDLAELCQQKQAEALAIIRREGFIFDGSGGRWEKLAFTFYTKLVSLASASESYVSDDSAVTPGSRPRLARRIADAMQRYVDRHASDEKQDGDWMFAVALSVLTADASDNQSPATEGSGA